MLIKLSVQQYQTKNEIIGILNKSVKLYRFFIKVAFIMLNIDMLKTVKDT